MVAGHTAVLPVIDTGVAGVDELVTANVLAVLLPQLLLAVTAIFPLLVPAVTVIVFVVEVPDHPVGNTQV